MERRMPASHAVVRCNSTKRGEEAASRWIIMVMMMIMVMVLVVMVVVAVMMIMVMMHCQANGAKSYWPAITHSSARRYAKLLQLWSSHKLHAEVARMPQSRGGAELFWDSI